MQQTRQQTLASARRELENRAAASDSPKPQKNASDTRQPFWTPLRADRATAVRISSSGGRRRSETKSLSSVTGSGCPSPSPSLSRSTMFGPRDSVHKSCGFAFRLKSRVSPGTVT